VDVASCGRWGPFFPKFVETATAGGPADYINMATAVCVTLLTPQNTATALDGVVADV